jgi:hypothetical protein
MPSSISSAVDIRNESGIHRLGRDGRISAGSGLGIAVAISSKYSRRMRR